MAHDRASAVRQYVVYHLKLVEMLHLMLMNTHFLESQVAPFNLMGHGIDQFRETLLGATVSAFMSIADKPSSTSIQEIWKLLYPRHAKAIDRIWKGRISAGQSAMKRYRDKAGVHGDRPHEFFAAKLGLIQDKEQILTALDAFLRLSILLHKRQPKDCPELSSEIEGVLLDVELASPGTGSFNRRWLRMMQLIDSGPYTKKFL